MDAKTLCALGRKHNVFSHLELVSKFVRSQVNTELFWSQALCDKYPEIGRTDSSEKHYVSKNFKRVLQQMNEYVKQNCDPVQLKNGLLKSGKIQNIKLAIIGSEFTGKSALLYQWKSHKFNENYDATVEDSHEQNLAVGKEKAFLHIKDTAGALEYKELREEFIRNSTGFILVYNVTDRNTFDDLDMFVHQIFTLKKVKVPMVVVGNKNDLKEKRQVSEQEGRDFAGTLDAAFFETSAKTRYNVEEAFTEATRRSMCATVDFVSLIPILAHAVSKKNPSRRGSECSVM